MRTIVIGLGNPILTDDSVGIKAARQLKQRLQGRAEVDVLELYAGGLRLMDALIGYERAVIIDATTIGDCQPGTVRTLALAECGKTRSMTCAHDAGLLTALELGGMLGCPLPGEIRIWGVEAADVETFGKELTAEVARALPELVDQVLRGLASNGGDGRR